MEWSFARKIKVVLLVGIVVVGLFLFLFWNILFPAPTCFDGKKNGDEQGRDCGGSCALYCPSEMRPIKVISARSFPIATGVVHSTAFLEQTNREAAIRNISYEFVYFDAEGKELARRAGSAPIGSFGAFVISETLVEVPRIPSYTTFSFTTEPDWERIPRDLAYPVIKTKSALSTSFPLGTRVTAEIENEAAYTFSDVPVTVLVYGVDGNVQTMSTVKLKTLPAKRSVPLVATWPFRFKEPVTKIEIYPLLDPFTATAL